MRFLIVFVLFFGIGKVFAEDKSSSQSLSVVSGGKTLVFVCDRARSEIMVFDGDGAGKASDLVANQKLDDSDSCSGGLWLVNELTGTDTKLVMVNPGRSGVNAQMNVYAVRGGDVKFSGYLPVGADYVGGSRYSYDFDQADGRWRDFYEVSDGKIRLSKEIWLVQSGGVCVDKAGGVMDGAECKGKAMHASENRPLCVLYDGRNGKIAPIEACSQLIDRP
ncbi:hypothetical protein BLA13014_05686 [Burkholderia aenigmatica]|uniref:Uncharacterized protein n=2 Tax=Burkholderia TaxID=32008 RepID=A0A6P2QBC8_9BURK|nr:hypothetical protein [Burkholderia aenigmatica]VWC20334.1 hypothetical protein BLA13014_05686 [Burkholderia aenigmatica]